MTEQIRLVGLAREKILADDAGLQFHRDAARLRQAQLDADREAFLARGGQIAVVPPGATGVEAPWGYKSPDVDQTPNERRRKAAAKKAARSRKAKRGV